MLITGQHENFWAGGRGVSGDEDQGGRVWGTAGYFGRRLPPTPASSRRTVWRWWDILFHSALFRHIHTVQLTKVVRQSHDNFIAAINQASSGQISWQSAELLAGLARPLTSSNAIHLYATNLGVDMHNSDKLFCLEGPWKIYPSKDEG